MPIHDWTRVKSGKFHDFHQDWVIEISRTLNGGLLPSGYSAETDQQVLNRQPETEAAIYARKANRLSIRLEDDSVVAIIEVLSPGNKDGKSAINSYKAKIVKFLRMGVNVVLIDLFPPTSRDPEGIHQLIWDQLTGKPFETRPVDKPLTVASYQVGSAITAYVDPVAVGDVLPDVPLFLAPGWYINIPLEQTYSRSWSLGPKSIRDLFEKS